MPLILGANSLAGGYQVKNSLRFNSGSSDRLNRTSSSQTAQKFTFSCWFKLSSNFTGRRNLFATDYMTNATTSGQSGVSINVWDNSTILLTGYGGSVGLTTTQLFRDPSAWYHLIWAVDTTQATSSNRFRIYINGSEVTSFSSSAYPPQNQNIEYKNHSIGSYSDQATYGGSQSYTSFFDGYQSECYLIDGQQLTPSSFGETDEDTGIWKPKAYTGTFGTNGFYLDFEDSANLGNDMSGNNNDFTVNNLTSIDQTTDTPTNNFATLNPLGNYYPASTFSEGNLQIVTSSGNSTFNNSTIGVSAGKWYCEVKNSSDSRNIVGIVDRDSVSTTDKLDENLYGYGYYDAGQVYNNGSTLTTYSSYTTNDIIGIALDLTNNKVFFSKNGTWQGSSDPATNTGGISITAPTSNRTGVYHFSFGDSGTTHSATHQVNFGNPPYSANSYTDGAGYGNFSYSVPSGFYSLNTKNLATFG